MAKKITRDIAETFHDYDIHMPTRTIYLGSVSYDPEHGESGTDGAMAERLIKNLHVLDQTEAPITIYMNNIGGCEYSCFAMIDAIKACKSHITIIAMGHAMSAGSLILQAADERIMGPLAIQMIHYGTWGVGADHSKTHQKWAKEGDRIDTWMEKYYMEKILEKNPRFKLKKLQEMLDHDTFLTAEQSIELGLCDRVLGQEPSEESQ